MDNLRQTTVIGLGLLGGSISPAVSRFFPKMRVVGYTHRPSTREKATSLSAATEVLGNIRESVSGADLVILATPIGTSRIASGPAKI